MINLHLNLKHQYAVISFLNWASTSGAVEVISKAIEQLVPSNLNISFTKPKSIIDFANLDI